jgi:serine/threonine protein phosphatase PrpC
MKQGAAATQPLRLVGAMRSHPGAVRPLNEDSVTYMAAANANGDAQASTRGSLMLVADGMGGHAAGEVASALAAETVRRVYAESTGPVPEILTSAFLAANRAIQNWAEHNPECKGMGTTCTAIAVRDNQAWLAHVGDSRAYILRNGVFTQLSEDQTLVAQMVREGKLTPEEAHNSPVSNVILQALGANAEVVPMVWSKPLPVLAGDIFVLCTDGLHGVVQDAAIAKQIDRLLPDEACEALIELAMAAGAPDNVSVGVFRVVAGAEAQDGKKTGDSARTTRRVAALDEAPAGDGAGQTRKLNVVQHETRSDA